MARLLRPEKIDDKYMTATAGNQARLGLMEEDTGGTSMSEERSNEAPYQECVICFGIIVDVNDRDASVISPCKHIFHRDCLERWMEEKVRFLIWFLQRWRMHLLLTKQQALTIVALFPCLS